MVPMSYHLHSFCQFLPSHSFTYLTFSFTLLPTPPSPTPSLSALHDGDTNGECANEEQYIMADKIRTPVARGHMGNPWLFSKCSIKKFQQYLER